MEKETQQETSSLISPETPEKETQGWCNHLAGCGIFKKKPKSKLSLAELKAQPKTGLDYYWSYFFFSTWKEEHNFALFVTGFEMTIAAASTFLDFAAKVFANTPAWLVATYYTVPGVFVYSRKFVSACYAVHKMGTGAKTNIHTSHIDIGFAENQTDIKGCISILEQQMYTVQNHYLELEQAINALPTHEELTEKKTALERQLNSMRQDYLRLKKKIDKLSATQEQHKITSKAAALRTVITDFLFNLTRFVGGCFIIYYTYFKEVNDLTIFTKITFAAQLLVLGAGTVASKIYKSYKAHEHQMKNIEQGQASQKRLQKDEFNSQAESLQRQKRDQNNLPSIEQIRKKRRVQTTEEIEENVNPDFSAEAFSH